MFIPQNDIIVCKRKEPEKTATVKATVVLLCCSMSVLSHEHVLLAFSKIGHPVGNDATASAQLEQNQECPHRTSANLS